MTAEGNARRVLIYSHDSFGLGHLRRCRAIANALVDIWQTDHQGIYDHAGDANQKKKDENFQSFGRFVTGS